MLARKRTVVAAICAIAASLTVVVAVAGATGGDRSNALERAIDNGRAKNVILLIGDGMGDSEITIARNYAVGANGRLALDTLPFTGAMTTYSVLESAPQAPDYTSESASTATAWSTGRKTSDGRISTSPGTDQDMTTILELAQRAGYRTGNVTTSELTDATPAGPMSHVRARECQGPLNMLPACPQDKKSAGGPGSIAEQSVDKRIDVLLGGGRSRYDQLIDGGPDAGRTVIQSAVRQGYDVATDRAGLLAAQGRPLLGLFHPGNMTVEWGGLPAANPPSGPQRCTEGLRPPNEPSLDEMTDKAIELLARNRHRNDDDDDDDDDDDNGGGRRGFFLQVESASIDKRDHASQVCEQIGETVNFDRAVRVALDYARRDDDTLVIVTADHAHTSQIVETNATPAGFSSKLITDEGQRMMVTYGTGNTPAGQGHTGSQLRIAAEGPQAANVLGVIDQTEVFRIIARALRVH